VKIKNIFGKEVNASFKKYRINWDRVISKPQKRVKDIICPYWFGQDVYEELCIPSSKLRIDLINLSMGVVIEVSPLQHQQYNEFLHGSRLNFLSAQKRDLQKVDWCEVNNFRYVEIDEEDLKLIDEEILNKILDK
jgi:hypothetical protein